jgi:hypothetical protein
MKQLRKIALITVYVIVILTKFVPDTAELGDIADVVLAVYEIVRLVK